MKKRIIKIMIGIGIFLSLIICAIIVVFIVSGARTDELMDDYSSIYEDDKYKESVLIDVSVFKQNISCGYAVIEMFSVWNGNTITEKDLYDEYGKVVTSTGRSFEKEMNKRFPEYKTTMKKYLKSSEMIEEIYNSLRNGKPVPIEWAALYNDEWTLHYSLVIGLDISNDTIIVSNPYGYIEKITLTEFFNRTSYKAYENMPLFLNFAFAFGIFEKNTIFIVE